MLVLFIFLLAPRVAARSRCAPTPGVCSTKSIKVETFVFMIQLVAEASRIHIPQRPRPLEARDFAVIVARKLSAMSPRFSQSLATEGDRGPMETKESKLLMHKKRELNKRTTTTRCTCAAKSRFITEIYLKLNRIRCEFLRLLRNKIASAVNQIRFAVNSIPICCKLPRFRAKKTPDSL